MTRDEFTSFTERTIENVIQAAEAKCGRKLSRDIRFQWLGHKPIEGNVVEELVSKVFVDSDHIYPCVDLVLAPLIERVGRFWLRTSPVIRLVVSDRTGLDTRGHMFT